MAVQGSWGPGNKAPQTRQLQTTETCYPFQRPEIGHGLKSKCGPGRFLPGGPRGLSPVFSSVLGAASWARALPSPAQLAAQNLAPASSVTFLPPSHEDPRGHAEPQIIQRDPPPQDPEGTNFCKDPFVMRQTYPQLPGTRVRASLGPCPACRAGTRTWRHLEDAVRLRYGVYCPQRLFKFLNEGRPQCLFRSRVCPPFPPQLLRLGFSSGKLVSGPVYLSLPTELCGLCFHLNL